ncbi:MAG: head maturation protease, ClpP-related [Candidatus Competibacteraceae bacterium]
MDIQIYNTITLSDASRISQQLRAQPNAPVVVDINSPGGEVPAALAIYNDLLAHAGPVLIRVTGVAASAATLICCAGTVEAAANALFMLHAPWLSTVGNAEALRQDATALDKHQAAMVGMYTHKTGRSEREITVFFDGKDHWLDANEAQALGLVDRIITPLKIAAEFQFGSLQCPSRYIMSELSPAIMAAQPTTFMAAADIHAAVHAANEPVLLTEFLARPHTHAEVQARIEYAKEVRNLSAIARQPERAAELIMSGLSEDKVKHNLWNALVAKDLAVGEIDTTPPPSMSTESFGGYGRRHFYAAAESALLDRMGIAHQNHPGAQDLRHTSLQSMAEITLRQSGRAIKSRSPSEVISAALTSSDFPALLSGTANRALVNRFEAAAANHRALTTTSTLRDFKAGKAVNVSFLPSLVKKPEAAEITYSAILDGAEPIQLATFARGLSFSREAMINDDLSALNKSIQAAANAAIRTERDLIFGVITANAAMSDTVALFHATHGNLGTGALSAATLGTARTYMRKQADSSGGYVLSVPRFLVVPVALETTAESIVAALSYRTDIAGPETNAPGWQNKLEVIGDPRLDAASASIWYLFSDPNIAPVIELAFLDGQTYPIVEQDADFDRDLLRFKIRFDVGVAAVGYAGAVKMA